MIFVDALMRCSFCYRIDCVVDRHGEFGLSIAAVHMYRFVTVMQLSF
jgi:hypothetical protein